MRDAETLGAIGAADRAEYEMADACVFRCFDERFALTHFGRIPVLPEIRDAEDAVRSLKRCAK
jgi:hypothetical protein